MVGATGSGKTTHAEALSKSTGAIRVGTDRFRGKKLNEAVLETLQAGHDVIVNGTHPAKKRREDFAAIARQVGATTRCIYMNANKTTAAKRSSLASPKQRYTVAGKFFKEFNALGDECDEKEIVEVEPWNKANKANKTNKVNKKRNSPNAGVSQTSGPRKKPTTNTRKNTRGPVEPLEPPSAMLAERYDPTRHKGTFFASEKLDGIRALAVDRRLYTRSGNPIAAPSWFLNMIPMGTFDGELYIGRGQFDAVSSTVMKKVPVDSEWKRVQYRIFDDHASPHTFSKTQEHLMKRMMHLKNKETDVFPMCVDGPVRNRMINGQLVKQFRPPVCLVWQKLLSDPYSIQRYHNDVKYRGGEGLILRRDVPYSAGRGSAMLKVKSHMDEEARVIGVNTHADGKFKSFEVEFLTGPHKGVSFSLAVNSVNARSQIKLGDAVTVEFFEYTKSGKPRFPVFKGVRKNIKY